MHPNRITEDGALAEWAWRGYDPRAAIPLIALAATISAALLTGRWYLDEFVASLVPYLVVLALWPSLLGLPLYRAITYTYRVTDRALLVDRGFLNRPDPPVWLKEVTSVKCGANWLHRQLGIGWVRATTTDGRSIKLSALRDPDAFASMLRERIETAARLTEG